MPNEFPILLPPFLNPTAGNPAGIGTPPFMPPSGDPYAELLTMLDRMQGQQFQQPQEGTLQTILNSLASGAAILASPDPGGTLSNQLNQRQARKDKVAQLNFERQNNLDFLRLNAAVEKARGLSNEQSTFRKEQREQVYKDKDLGRDLKLAQGKQDILLQGKEQEFRLDQKLYQEYEPLINARLKNETFIRDFPQQRKDSLEWEALARTAMPNLNPIVAKTIAEKQAGLNREPLTVEETDIVKKVNQTANKQFQEERSAKLNKIKAETSREYAEAAYTNRNKPGQSAFQDRFMNNYQSVLGQNAADRIARFYYKNPKTGEILTDKEWNAIDFRVRPDKLDFKPMSNEENAAQRAIESQRFVEANEAVESQKQQQSVVKPSDISSKAQQVLEVARAKGRTPEQTKVMLQANGVSIEEINKLFPQAGQSQFTPTDIPTPLLEYGQQQTRPRMVQPISDEDRASFESLQKAVEKERKKRNATRQNQK